MKKTLLLCGFWIILSCIWGQTVVTIGTGTDSQPYPFDLEGGYARSASIYTASEIGSSGFITSLGWEVVTGDIHACPVKIYLAFITDGSLYSISWDALTDGATLVYNGTLSFPEIGWKTIDIADFVFTNTNGHNLLVLCEANYGGNGATSAPYFAYSYNPDQHETWHQYETPPTDPGMPDAMRPNIQVSYQQLSFPHPPSGFIASSAGTGQINLSWTKNASNNNVMVAFNSSNVFGTPSGNYIAGNAISGGGTVIYNGAGSVYEHTTGLNPATTYYYKAWSVVPPAPVYSVGTGSSATTQCLALGSFPNTTDFESTVFPPVCWSIAQTPWIRSNTVSANGTGTGSIQADFYNSGIPAGASFDIMSPDLDLSSLSNPKVTFDHAYATFSDQVDVLELWVSYDYGFGWSLVSTWLGGSTGALNTGGQQSTSFVPAAGQWASKSFSLPPGTTKILFRGISAYGNNLYLDNIAIGDELWIWNGNLSDQWHNNLNWTPNTIPSSIQDVVIQPGCPNFPVISTADPVCKNLLIKTGASITVLSGATLTIDGNAIIQDGATMTINH